VPAARRSDQTLFDPVSDGPIARDPLQLEHVPLPRIGALFRYAIRRRCGCRRLHSVGFGRLTGFAC
jgi:hypothetical protein